MVTAMVRNYARHLLLLLALLALLPPAQALAAVQVGRVLTAVGKVTARDSDGKERALKRRSPVFEGDVVTTGTAGRTQIRFKDSALVELVPATEFRVDAYRYDGKADGSENAAMTLLKGGLRTVSGVIGHEHKASYKMNTPVATIGIRGTFYDLAVTSQGLFGGVNNGQIVVTNGSGTHPFGQDQFFHVADAGSAPQALLKPPEVLLQQQQSMQQQEGEEQAGDQQGSSDAQGDGSSDSSADSGDQGTGDTSASSGDGTTDTTGSTEQTDTTLADAGTTTDDGSLTGDTGLLDTTADTTTYQATSQTTSTSGSGITSVSGTPLGAGSAVGVAMLNTDPVDGGIDAGGDVIIPGTDGAALVDTVNGVPNVMVYGEKWGTATDSCNPCTFSRGTGTLAGNGHHVDATAGYAVDWGRWEGGYVITENGVEQPHNGPFQYAVANGVLGASDVKPLTGTAYFSNFLGGTGVDQNGGNVTVLTSWIDVSFGDSQSYGTLNAFNIGVKASDGRYYEGVLGYYDPVNHPNTVVNVPLSDVIAGADIPIIGCTAASGTTCSGSTGIDGDLHLQFLGSQAQALLAAYGMRVVTVGSPSSQGVSGLIVLGQ